MKVYLLPNYKRTNASGVARRVCEILHAEGVELITDHESHELGLNEACVTVMSPDDAMRACDILLCIGGDGTMLHAARRVMLAPKPLLGINTGRLGFLTAIEDDELDQLRLLARGQYRLEERMVIEACCEGLAERCVAMNDIVLFKTSPERAISLNIYCDDIPVSRSRGDGVVFATPTGSTAYSMSAGGPIVDARLGGIVVTQICAHIVQTPPLVFASDRVLRVIPAGYEDETVSVISDGITCGVLQKDQPVIIRQSGLSVQLIQFNEAQQLQSIDKKLKGR